MCTSTCPPLVGVNTSRLYNRLTSHICTTYSAQCTYTDKVLTEAHTPRTCTYTRTHGVLTDAHPTDVHLHTHTVYSQMHTGVHTQTHTELLLIIVLEMQNKESGFLSACRSAVAQGACMPHVMHSSGHFLPCVVHSVAKENRLSVLL